MCKALKMHDISLHILNVLAAMPKIAPSTRTTPNARTTTASAAVGIVQAQNKSYVFRGRGRERAPHDAAYIMRGRVAEVWLLEGG
jgi:hypothetical protein